MKSDRAVLCGNGRRMVYEVMPLALNPIFRPVIHCPITVMGPRLRYRPVLNLLGAPPREAQATDADAPHPIQCTRMEVGVPQRLQYSNGFS